MADQFTGSHRRYGKSYCASFDSITASDEADALLEIKRRRIERTRARSEHYKSVYEQKKLDGITLPYVSIQHKPFPVD